MCTPRLALTLCGFSWVTTYTYYPISRDGWRKVTGWFEVISKQKLANGEIFSNLISEDSIWSYKDFWQKKNHDFKKLLENWKILRKMESRSHCFIANVFSFLMQ